jgi:hypothetical protein
MRFELLPVIAIVIGKNDGIGPFRYDGRGFETVGRKSRKDDESWGSRS